MMSKLVVFFDFFYDTIFSLEKFAPGIDDGPIWTTCMIGRPINWPVMVRDDPWHFCFLYLTKWFEIIWDKLPGKSEKLKNLNRLFSFLSRKSWKTEIECLYKNQEELVQQNLSLNEIESKSLFFESFMCENSNVFER